MNTTNRRILIVDDNVAIHSDFAKILAPKAESAALDAVEALLFDAAPTTATVASFDLGFAKQGEEALAMVIAARLAGKPFALAFIDMRMPPGWDGLVTIEKLWEVDADLQIVICSAYSDYSWNDIHARLGDRDSLLIIKKPFDTAEVTQCSLSQTEKWNLARRARARMGELEAAVSERTAELSAVTTRLVAEIERRDRVEGELRLAQKLEAIGQLAAGIAHEINTPIQYVSDSLQFISDGTNDLLKMAVEMQDTAHSPRSETSRPLADDLDSIAVAADMPYLAANVPGALARIQEGIQRITTIVQAMKELSHPGPRELTPIDINRVLDNSLEVTANAYKSVADIKRDSGMLPMVMGYAGDLSQVFINLIINAAQAMEHSDPRGTLGVRSFVDGSDVVISISDTGSGIPDAIRPRIFEAFFTTKEVGKGTGQGLAISRSIVVDRHGGTLKFDSALDVGTTFHVRLPIAGPYIVVAAAA